MKYKWLKKLGRIFKAALPTAKEFSFLTKALILVFLVGCFWTIYNYTSTANAQTESRGTVMDGMLRGLRNPIVGCASYADGIGISSATATAGADANIVQNCTKSLAANATTDTAFVEINYGAMGRVINATSSTYDVNLAQPGTTVEYYASNITGRVMAADNPTSGRSTLAPVFTLNQIMVNLAYAMVVIVLLVSSLGILIGSIAGGEERFTVIQLMINAGITLIVITFYYEIAAIIFDLVVNYGNSLVASIMSPYINSYAILERLQPGGDLTITSVLNTFQYSGVTDSMLTVTRNISAALYPALAQSASVYARTFALEGIAPDNPVTGIAYAFLVQSGSTGSTLTISAGVASFLGNTEVFSTIIEWALFLINLKIFINLIMAFLTFSFSTAFGPVIALGAISGGFEKITESFKSLAQQAAVFPLSLGLILLGAAATNITIRSDGSGDTTNASGTRQVLCKYSPKDPANTENTYVGNPWGDLANTFIPRDQSFLDPSDSRIRNFLNQNIFDATPANIENGVEDCRSKLFPVPWTYIPAPFGTLGIRSLQVQTLDSLVRTFLGLIFLVLAARAPGILEEVIGVKSPGFLGGIQNSFKQGFSSFLGVGATALGIGLPISKWLAGSTLKTLGKFPVPGGSLLARMRGDRASQKDLRRNFETVFNSFTGKWEAKKDPITGKPIKRNDYFANARNGKNSIGSIFNAKHQFTRDSAFGKDAYMSSAEGFREMGLPSGQASMLAGQSVLANFDKITKQISVFGTVLQGATSGLEQLTKVLGEASGSIQKFIALDAIDGI